jgi:hypothetical protein
MFFQYSVPSATWNLDQTIEKKKDSIFKSWARIVNSNCVGDLSRVNQETVLYKVLRHPDIELYLNKFPELFVRTSVNIQRYIMYVYEGITTEKEMLAKGATPVLQKQIKAKKALLSPPDYTIKTFILQNMTDLNSREIYTKLKSWAKEYLSFLALLINNFFQVGVAKVKELTGTPFAIWPQQPLTSAFIEEIIKCIPWLGWRVIGLLDSAVHNDWNKWRWHRNSMRKPYAQRLQEHVELNKPFQARQRTSSAISIDQSDCLLLESSILLPTSYISNIPTISSAHFNWEDNLYAKSNSTKPIKHSHLDLHEDCFLYPRIPSMSIPMVEAKNNAWGYCHSNNLTMRLDKKIYAPTYISLSPISGMVKPAASLDNFRAAVFFRVVDIARATSDPNVLLTMVDHLPSFCFNYDEDQYQIWFSKLKPIQKKRILEVERKIQNNEPLNLTVQVFTKSDEYLPTHEKMVPRVIYNVPPYYLMELGSFVDQLSHYLVDNVWSKKPKFFTVMNGKPVSAFFTCGASSEDLNIYLNAALNGTPGIYILVMGDDTLAIDSTGIKIKFIETDYSKFDATQTKELRDVFHKFLDLIGCSAQRKIWEEMYEQPVRYYHRGTNTKLNYPAYSTLYTGEPGTCLRNSITNIMVSAIAIAYDDPSVYTRAGLIVKRKIFEDIQECTFLRGAFLLNREGTYQWTRLPSFILKFGKSFSDPLCIYPKTWTRSQRWEQFLYSQWKGYGEMNTNWFYSSLQDQINRLTPNRKTDEEIKLTNYQVYSDVGDFIEDEIFDKFMEKRYGITRIQAENFIDTLSEIPRIPALYVDPIIDVLLRRDY